MRVVVALGVVVCLAVAACDGGGGEVGAADAVVGWDGGAEPLPDGVVGAGAADSGVADTGVPDSGAPAEDDVAIAAPPPEEPGADGLLPGEADDPLVVAIAAVTSPLSDAGVQIRDSEWGDVGQGIAASRLPLERLRQAVDQVFVVAPCLSGITCAPPLPAALRFDDALAADAPTTPDAWAAAAADGARPAERLVLFALPSDVRWRARGLLAAEDYLQGAVIDLFAEAVRAPDGALVAFDVTFVVSDCGWCQLGVVYTLGPGGALLETRYPSRYTAQGYCC